MSTDRANVGEEDMGGLVEARVTVHMVGVKPGDVVLVDPTVPFMAKCLEKGFLAPLGEGSEGVDAAQN